MVSASDKEMEAQFKNLRLGSNILQHLKILWAQPSLNGKDLEIFSRRSYQGIVHSVTPTPHIVSATCLHLQSFTETHARKENQPCNFKVIWATRNEMKVYRGVWSCILCFRF